MPDRHRVPQDPVAFIRNCVRGGKIFWTYHVNMRLRSREIPRRTIVDSIEKYEVVEAYPDDKYLPSYLIWTEIRSEIVHILFAVDLEGQNVRVVTAYRPDPAQWCDNGKRRRTL